VLSAQHREVNRLQLVNALGQLGPRHERANDISHGLSSGQGLLADAPQVQINLRVGILWRNFLRQLQRQRRLAHATLPVQA